MKLEKYGLDQYNIRGIDTYSINTLEDKNIKLLFPWPAKEGDQGNMLTGLINTGADYYDLPLFQNAPGFPFALILSHKLFAIKNQPYAVAFYSNKILMNLKLKSVFKTQFFAVIVPLFFSVMTIIAIFLLGRYLFSSRVGLYAAFIYSINPVNLLTSQKVWADDMLTFFVVIAVIIFVLAFKKKIPFIAFFAGVTCGIAVLAKQSGILLLPAIWLFMVLSKRKGLRNIRGVFSAAFNNYFLFFLAGLIISTGFWFYKVYLIYGTPFFMPDTSDVVSSDITGWFKTLTNRPHGYVLYSIGIPYICPIFLLAYFSIKKFILEIKNIILGKNFNYEFIILWLWILTFFVAVAAIGGKEHRYMLPIYPSLAILSAYYLDRVREYIEYKKSKSVGTVVIICFLALAASWTIPMGLDVIMKGGALLLRPF